MSDVNKQHISALMDDALSGDKSRFLLRRVQHDPDLVRVWSRYHLMRDCLQGHPAVLVSTTFADRVMGHVQHNAATSAPPRSRGGRWMQWGAGGAIAASVAVAALVLTQPPLVPAADTLATSTSELSAAAPVAATSVSAAPPATNDFNLLLNQSRSRWWYVQPAAATRYQKLGYLQVPTLYAQQQQWVHRDGLNQAGIVVPLKPTFVLRASGQAVPRERGKAVDAR